MKILITTVFFYISFTHASITAITPEPWLKIVAIKANCVLKREEFLNEVKLYPKFTHTNNTSSKVAEDLRALPEIKVATYKSKNPFTKAVATTYPKEKNKIYLNLRHNPRPVDDMVATLCHESTHVLGYSHGDNNPAGKENSVPYKVQTICVKFLQLCN